MEISADATIGLGKDGFVHFEIPSGTRNLSLGFSKIRSSNGQNFQMEHSFFIASSELTIRYQNTNLFSVNKSNYGTNIKLTLERVGNSINYYIDDEWVYSEPERDTNGAIGSELLITAGLLYTNQSRFNYSSITEID